MDALGIFDGFGTGSCEFQVFAAKAGMHVRRFCKKSNELGVSINDLQDRREGPEYVGV